MVGKEPSFNPFQQYSGKGPSRRQRFVRWFHNNRLKDFGEHVQPGETLLSVGAGTAELESKILADKFDSICTIDPRESNAEDASKKGLGSIRGAVPPVPFESESFDCIVASGTMEHLPDEREFIEDAHRCLKPDGELVVTLPIEVGAGGWIRYLAKNFVHPDRSDSPDGIRRYVDYSWEELRKACPRGKNDTAHRYYNYTYALADLRDVFSNVSIVGWPINPLKQLNFILIVIAEK